jgi:hypothetical protein
MVSLEIFARGEQAQLTAMAYVFAVSEAKTKVMPTMQQSM